MFLKYYNLIMIKNIVFDMGGVLLDFNGKKTTERFVEDVDLRETFFNEVFRSVEWMRLDRGTITEEEAVEAINSRLPKSLHSKTLELLHHWYDVLYPIEGMGELMNELKGKGYNLYILSNASTTLHEYVNRVPGVKNVTSVFCSADYKCMKPELEIYHKFFEVNDLIPEECIFIDDNAINIEACLRTNMDGIIFNNVLDLRNKLKLKGIL